MTPTLIDAPDVPDAPVDPVAPAADVAVDEPLLVEDWPAGAAVVDEEDLLLDPQAPIATISPRIPTPRTKVPLPVSILLLPRFQRLKPYPAQIRARYPKTFKDF
jgi:hypothetical protein